MPLVHSNLIVHLQSDDQWPDALDHEGKAEPDEEFWEVVTLEDDGEMMVTMPERTLASIVGSIAGFKDYTIVPIRSVTLEGDDEGA